MIRIAVSGAGGRMGRLVAATVEAAAGGGAAGETSVALTACYDPAHGGSSVSGHEVSTTPGVVAGCDVVVEFTRPDVVMANLAEWRRLGVHAVVGTSGFDADRIAAVRELWGSGGPNCLIVPNFSIGAVVMMRLAELAAPHFAAAEIIELHHDRKVDAPSGTALATAERISAAAPDQRRAVDGEESVTGARGGEASGIPVHSVRLPGYVAHQEVLLGNPGETLSIRHDTTDRESFMPGVLLAVRGVAGLDEPVTVGLEGLLGI
jgi:4-hydroxy-tetrahydrodipicolinate reductase